MTAELGACPVGTYRMSGNLRVSPFRSLNMLIEREDGFDYTGAQFDAWSTRTGFTRTEVVQLAGPGSGAIAYK